MTAEWMLAALVDPGTGIYFSRRRQQYEAYAANEGKVVLLGACSAAASEEVYRHWRQDIYAMMLQISGAKTEL